VRSERRRVILLSMDVPSKLCLGGVMGNLQHREGAKNGWLPVEVRSELPRWSTREMSSACDGIERAWI
jgi:hypothetical protein